MDLKEYQLFTSIGIHPASEGKDLLVGFALGLAGESGEVIDAIKKRVYHGRTKDITIEHIEEELGDVMWYIANICNALDLDINEVLLKNVTKLKNRYPQLYGGNENVKTEK